MRLSCIILLPMLAYSCPATAELDRGSYVHRPLGLSLSVPEGWELTRQTGYPGLLAQLFSARGGATIALALGELRQGQSLRQFVADNGEGARAVGLRIFGLRRDRFRGREAWRLAMETRDEQHQVRQIYFLHAGRVIIFTLTATAPKARELAPELQRTLEALELAPPSRAEPEP